MLLAEPFALVLPSSKSLGRILENIENIMHYDLSLMEWIIYVKGNYFKYLNVTLDYPVVG